MQFNCKFKNESFIIGNGFDINLGLATQYENFYRFYLGLDSSNDSIQVKKLKEHLKNDQDQESRYQYWSDLEIGMGNYTVNFSNVKELKEAYYDLNDRKGKLKGYSYSAANEGEHSVSISLPPNGERFVGSIHSHGDADAEHINNKFSKADT